MSGSGYSRRSHTLSTRARRRSLRGDKIGEPLALNFEVRPLNAKKRCRSRLLPSQSRLSR